MEYINLGLGTCSSEHEYTEFVLVKYVILLSRWHTLAFEMEILRMRSALGSVAIFGLLIKFPNKWQMYLITQLSF